MPGLFAVRRFSSGVHDVQPALDPFQTEFDATDPLGLRREVAVQQGDLGSDRRDAAAKVGNIVERRSD
jgi:hypothetical protein